MFCCVMFLWTFFCCDVILLILEYYMNYFFLVVLQMTGFFFFFLYFKNLFVIFLSSSLPFSFALFSFQLYHMYFLIIGFFKCLDVMSSLMNFFACLSAVYFPNLFWICYFCDAETFL